MRSSPGAAAIVVLVIACGSAGPQSQSGGSSPASSGGAVSTSSPMPAIQPARCVSSCPSSRNTPGLALDTDRQALILFGGYGPDGNVLGDTWEWSAARGWSKPSTKTAPAARGMTAMAYDPARHVVVMYGGRGTVGGTVPCGQVETELCSADTWTWNGTDWIQLHTGSSPDPFVPSMTFDASVNALLLYNIKGNMPQTWTWDGANWTLKASGSGNPIPSRYSSVMAFDPATRHVLMFGGFSQGGGDVDNMWSWSGQAWASLGTDAPLLRLQSAAAGDVDRNMLLGYQNPDYSGSSASSARSIASARTWRWDGSRWAQIFSTHQPSVFASGLFDDPKSHQVLLVGVNPIRGGALEIWAWKGNDWSQLA